MQNWTRKPSSINSNEITFQALTWKSYDYENQFHITCCGCNENGDSIGMTVNNFTPTFYVQIPTQYKTWTSDYTEKFTEFIKKRLGGKKEHLTQIKIVKAKILYPFTNQKSFPFLKLKFTSQAAFKTASYIFKKDIKWHPDQRPSSWKLYESNIDPMLRFCHTRNINTAGWIKIKNYVDTQTQFSQCKFNVSVKHTDIEPILDKQATAPFVLGSFDIECDSKATRDKHAAKFDINTQRDIKKELPTIFPDANRRGDQIRIICTTLWKYGTDQYLKHAVCIAPCNTDETDADICECAQNERELLIKWFAFIKNTDPDVLMGWNIYGFDDEYIFKRLLLHDLTDLMTSCTRITHVEGSMKDSKLVTAAYGSNFFRIMDMPGIYKVDLYVWFKRETKLESYKLDSVSEHYLKENKIDLLPIDLFFKMNIDGKTMAECVKYCVQDTLLPLRLTHARMIFINLVGMANITRVPIEWLITRGQQIKVFSQITYETRLSNVLVPVWDNEESNEKFLGATVLHANKGAYFEAVSGLDFASLYPSIMIAFNLCYSTMIDPRNLEDVRKSNHEIETIEWEQKDETTGHTTKQTYHFVQNVQGILPRILDKLWKQRKAVKKLMKKANKEKNSTLEGIYNAEQLAIKVSMNSVYGFTGATNGFLPMKPIASSVTAKGRHLIEITKNHCEKTFECEVVYGDTDSCYVKFVARNPDGSVLKPEEPGYMQEIFRLSELAANSCNKHLYKKPVELEFEKVMYPFLLFTKKRYAYLEWVTPEKSDHLDAKGIHLVRRDVCPYVQDISKLVLNTLFYDRDIKKAKEIAEKSVGDLITNKVPTAKLKLSKTLRTGYKCSKCHVQENELGQCSCPNKIPTINLPHVQLAKRLKEQNSIDPPQSGERIPYVFIEGTGLQHERVQHPELLSSSQKIDGLYYLEHQLRVPLETLLELVLTPENGYRHGTAEIFEKGVFGNTLKLLKEASMKRDVLHKNTQRIEATKQFAPGMRVKRKIKANEFINGTVENVNLDEGKVTVKLDNNKTCNIFPDSLSEL